MGEGTNEWMRKWKFEQLNRTQSNQWKKQMTNNPIYERIKILMNEWDEEKKLINKRTDEWTKK